MSNDTKNYQVLARKWRPQTFADLVGQEHVTRTLQNTIAQDRVGHAYLFVGSRGIGKTSGARIFAKALNCESGRVTEPCCKCQSCIEIANGTSMDVIEIDGASHNKVEDVRDIRDNVMYTPNRGRYKIYILDEVHMLTSQAWNALLKTLEEPPPHVKFFFATTEPHKVLPTVVSRCQRFDLKRIPVPLIVNRLQEIITAEGVQADERALGAIARAADGGMRDALSILDQIIAFCGGRDSGTPIQESDVIEVFGLASGLELYNMAAAMLNNDVATAMTIIQQLADQGRDLERLFADMIQFMRNVMIATVCPDPTKLLEVTAAELEDLNALVQAARPQLVNRILDGLIASENSIRHALNKRIFLEAAVVRILRETHSMQIDDLIARLNDLRQGGLDIPVEQAPPPSIPLKVQEAQQTAQPDIKKNDLTPPDNPPAPPQATAPPVKLAETTQPEAAQPTPVADEKPLRPEDDLPPWETDETPAVNAAAGSVQPTPTPDPEPVVETEPLAVQSESAPVQISESEDAPEFEEYDSESEEDYESEADVSDLPVTEDECPPAPIDESDDESDLTAMGPEEGEAAFSPVDAWDQLMIDIATRPGGKLIRPLLAGLKPVSIINNILAVAYEDNYPKESLDMLQQPDNQDLLQDCIRRILGNPEAKLVIKRYLESVSSESLKERLKSTPEIWKRVEAKPFVQQIRDQFGGTIVDVRGL